MAKDNIYMGFNSVAGIPANGKVNEDWEILLNLYATAYDATNDILLTHTPGKYTKTDVKTIRDRFHILKMLAKKYKPSLYPDISQIESMTIRNLQGKISDSQFLAELRKMLRKHGISDYMINEVEQKINFAESLNSVHNFIPNFKLNFLNFNPRSSQKSKSKSKSLFNFDFDFFNEQKTKPKRQKSKPKKEKSFFDFNFDFDFFNFNKKIRRKR